MGDFLQTEGPHFPPAPSFCKRHRQSPAKLTLSVTTRRLLALLKQYSTLWNDKVLWMFRRPAAFQPPWGSNIWKK